MDVRWAAAIRCAAVTTRPAVGVARGGGTPLGRRRRVVARRVAVGSTGRHSCFRVCLQLRSCGHAAFCLRAGILRSCGGAAKAASMDEKWKAVASPPQAQHLTRVDGLDGVHSTWNRRPSESKMFTPRSCTDYRAVASSERVSSEIRSAPNDQTGGQIRTFMPSSVIPGVGAEVPNLARPPELGRCRRKQLRPACALSLGRRAHQER